MPDGVDALVGALSGLGDAAFSALEELAACGNRALALRCWERSAIRAADRFGGRVRLERAPAPAAGVFFPVVHGDLALLCSVELSGSAPAGRWDEVAQAAAYRAIAEAWHDAGGEGSVPDAHPLIRPRCVHVEGASLHAAVYLAALSHFGGQPVTDPVLATGHPEHAPDRLDDKAALAGDLGLELIVVSPRPAARPRTFRTTRDAASFVFTIVPWAPDAAVVRVHVHAGAIRGTPPGGLAAHLIELPEQMGPEDTIRAVQQLGELMRAAPRLELSVAGPMPLVAALGHAARNHQTAVRLVTTDGAGRKIAVWHNKVQRPVSFGARSDEARVVIGGAGRRVPAGWELVDVGNKVTPADLGGCVDRVLVRHGATQVLHLAFATWLPLVWAVSAQLRNQGLRVYYHFERGRYVPWVRCEASSVEIADAPG